MASLIPKADSWLQNDFNALLVGLHGVGKTRAVVDLAKKHDIKLKYYSCSTLDPYTDLVGVPVPKVDDDGTEYLKMVRPRDLDEAEMIFFDEFNRADPKVHNALLEIIQFRTINGEALPNLRCVWAAMNPPGQDYNVEDLDAALVDRFDVFEDVTAKPSADYYVKQGIRKEIAQALVGWWQEQSRTRRDISESITPRRLEKIGLVYEKTGDFKAAIPNWTAGVERAKLRDMLKDAEAKASGKSTSTDMGPEKSFTYNSKWMEANNDSVAAYLDKNTENHETHKAVLQAVGSRQGQSLAQAHGEVLSALVPSMLEGYLTDMSGGKFNSLVDAVAKLPEWRKDQMKNLVKAVATEKGNR